MITRFLQQQLPQNFGRNKVLVVLGPRQVGKTTLLASLCAECKNKLVLDCDNYDDQLRLERKTKTELENMVRGCDALFIDEAQRVRNIGLTLKMLGDLHLNIPIVVTGSSSLELADEINEPATGRLLEYNLYPFSLAELATETSEREEERLLSQRLIYGCYPEVVNYPSNAQQTLTTLTNSYLYKDLLEYKGIKKPNMLRQLVVALALQVGQEVSYNELSNMLDIDKETVENYIDLLEKCFVVFRLNAFSRNQRNEIKKGKKIFFYDNGVRNAVIANFAPLELRNDVGALWENLMISERIKRNAYSQSYAQSYFWRSNTQKEVDYIEWKDGKLEAFEFKWKGGKRATKPKLFDELYPDTSFSTITPTNFWEFVK